MRTAWPTAFIDYPALYVGEGTTWYSTSGAVSLGSFLDGAGESYTITEATVVHTYNSPGSTFTAYIDSCCRIGGLQNIGDDLFGVETVVQLGADNNGPSISVPAIVQFNLGVMNSINLGGFITGKFAQSYQVVSILHSHLTPHVFCGCQISTMMPLPVLRSLDCLPWPQSRLLEDLFSV